MKLDTTKIILIINVKELYNNNDSKEEKDLVDNHVWRRKRQAGAVYIKVFVYLLVYVYLYT